MLLKKLLTIIMVCGSAAAFAQNVGINSDASTPDASAMLDVKATDKGVLIPRMTEAQRNAIASPATGLLIYQTDNAPGFYFNSGTTTSPAWSVISTGGDVQGNLNGVLIGQGSGNASTFTPASTANNQFLSTPTAGGVPTWTTPSNVMGSAVVNVVNGNGQGVGTGNLDIDVAGAAGGILHGTGSSSAFTAPGNTGDVLVSNGSGAPTWAAPNTTLTTSSLTGSPVVAITNGAGQLVGSTNASFDVVGANGGVLYGTGTSSAFTNPSTANNQVLATPTAGGTPTWVNTNSTLTTSNIAPATSSTVVVTNGSNQVVGSSPVTVDVQGAAGGVMYGAGAAPAAFTPVGTAGQYLKSNGAAAPTWTNPKAYFSIPCSNNGNNQPSGTTTLVGYSGLTWNTTAIPNVNMGTQVVMSGSFYQAHRNVSFVRASGWLSQTAFQAGSYLVSIYKYTNASSGSCGNAIGNVVINGTLVGSCTLTFGTSEIAQKWDIDVTSLPVTLAAGDLLVLYVTNNSGINKTWVSAGTADFFCDVQ